MLVLLFNFLPSFLIVQDLSGRLRRPRRERWLERDKFAFILFHAAKERDVIYIIRGTG